MSCKALIPYFFTESEMPILRTHTHCDNNITLVKLSLFSPFRKRRCLGGFLCRRQDSMCVCHQAPRPRCSIHSSLMASFPKVQSFQLSHFSSVLFWCCMLTSVFPRKMHSLYFVKKKKKNDYMIFSLNYVWCQAQHRHRKWKHSVVMCTCDLSEPGMRRFFPPPSF